MVSVDQRWRCGVLLTLFLIFLQRSADSWGATQEEDRDRQGNAEKTGPNEVRAREMARQLMRGLEYRTLDQLEVVCSAKKVGAAAPAADQCPRFEHAPPDSDELSGIARWATSELASLPRPDAEATYLALLEDFLVLEEFDVSEEMDSAYVDGKETMRYAKIRAYPAAGLKLSPSDLAILVSIHFGELTKAHFETLERLSRQVLSREPGLMDGPAQREYRAALLAEAETDALFGRKLPLLLLLAGDERGSQQELEARFSLGPEAGLEEMRNRYATLMLLSLRRDVREEFGDLHVGLLKELVARGAPVEDLGAHVRFSVRYLYEHQDQTYVELLETALELGLSEELIRAVAAEKLTRVGWDICLLMVPRSTALASQVSTSLVREWCARAYVTLADLARIRSDFGDPLVGKGWRFSRVRMELKKRFEALSDSSPPELVLERIPEALRDSCAEALARITLEIGLEDQVVTRITRLSASVPGLARELALAYVESWAARNQPIVFDDLEDEEPLLLRPLDAQLDAMERFRSLVERFEAIPGCEDLDPDLVPAFARIHSVAEVFRDADIARVFGPIDQLPALVAARLAGEAVQRLAEDWMSWETQQMARTGRSEDEFDRQVMKAYELTDCLIMRAQTAPKNSPPVAEGLKELQDHRLTLLRARARVYRAHYVRPHDQKESYLDFRRDALALAQVAAAEYANSRSRGACEPSIEVYLTWLHAIATGTKEPDPEEIAALRRKLAELGPREAAWHYSTLGRAWDAQLAESPPDLRYFMARGFAELLGEDPAAAEAREIAHRCDQLLAGLRLHVELDGSYLVGTDRPFGLFVSFRYRPLAARASGGFGRYLRNELDHEIDEDRPPVNYRADNEKRIQLALAPSFEIVSIQLHDQDVLPRELEGADAGWLETPLAYVIAHTRDAATAEIPPIALDLDFFRADGETVILPLLSAPLPLDASRRDPVCRPLEKLRLELTVDDRDLADERVVVSVRASAIGVLPQIEDLLDLSALAPFELVRTLPGETTIVAPDKHSLRSASEQRTEFVLDSSTAPVGTTLRLPGLLPAGPEEAELVFRRYLRNDEGSWDVVPCEVAVDLYGWDRLSRRWLAVPIVMLIAVLGMTIELRRRRRVLPPAPPSFEVPPSAGPVEISKLLRRLDRHPELAWSEEERRVLRAAIVGLEEAWFGSGESAESVRLAAGWIERAGRVYSAGRPSAASPRTRGNGRA